ncbi:MAG TPA: sulfatase-like hydrolase/transferase [Candidatus Limnocylindrales bacterium]|nr:sulfatase-like hydrolase/transferase [Candidatus Limnocylindrales bacterium]
MHDNLRRALGCLLAFALLGLPATGAAPVRAAPERPNIVVIYLDDVAPHDGRLWSQPELTPTLAERFVGQGIHFRNAIVEDPLCCPGRGNLLSGLHTHNNGVNSNHARKFKPSMHIGSALRDAGYATMFLGKYYNRTDVLSAGEWSAHAAGWTQFDVINGPNGTFYNYTLFTKDEGNIAFGDYHTTQMVADRFISRSRALPADKPIFAILSIYNLHAPNTPMPQFAGDPRCASMPSWKPPNYNEADMSDKPAFQQSRPLLGPKNGWPMVRYCEEMLGVDWAVEQVVNELEAQDRLDNTLLVFTADNGMAWGAHRLGQHKRQPFTTPVPLYMTWPAGWGTTARTINELTSNIDLAPTFCELGGCTLGPYPGGQGQPDGVSLVPLISGEAPHLGRDALLERHADPALARHWYALRTTSLHPAGRWHYVEWSTGERELYDLANDPWELNNLADRSATATLRATLSTRLAQLKAEGRTTARPDGSVALAQSGPYKGVEVFSATPIKAQTRRHSNVVRGRTYSFWVQIHSTTAVPDTYRLSGSDSGTLAARVTYWAGTADITAAVNAGTYSVTAKGKGLIATIEVRMAIEPNAGTGKRRAMISAAPASDPALLDVVRAVVVR